MKTVLKNVYYCDHCNKRLLDKGKMSTHEKHCTANPHRDCRMCEESIGLSAIVESFKARYTLEKNEIPPSEPDYIPQTHFVTWVGDPVTLREVLEASDHCPMCTLAILRQAGLNRHYMGCELNPDYITIAENRLRKELGLFQ